MNLGREGATLGCYRASRPLRSLSTGRVGVPFSARFHPCRSGRHPDGVPVGGLRMSQDHNQPEDTAFVHRPVMVAEVVALLAEVPAGVFLDATVGAGGHAAALLDAHRGLRVVGVDQDPAALEAAGAALARFGDRVVLRRARFDRAGALLDELGVDRLAGALFDLGVSSPQFDRPGRGFSYRLDAPLDMRMDPDASLDAATVVNTWSLDQLTRLLAANGEGRFARRIARAIVDARPVLRTGQLAEVVRTAIPAAARRQGGHPARRVFQAIRIEVNQELEILPGALDDVITRLTPGGRLVVLAYHSGEDRIVKERFSLAATGGCTCPPGLPCVCGARPLARLLNRRAGKPSDAEVIANPRAQSARLRAIERLEDAEEER